MEEPVPDLDLMYVHILEAIVIPAAGDNPITAKVRGNFHETI